MSRPAMTREELLALPAAVPLQTAARALGGIGRTKAYSMVKEGTWPTPLLVFGAQYRVPLASILRLLEIEPAARPRDPSDLEV